MLLASIDNWYKLVWLIQLAQLQMELQRMNSENKKLKEMLNHVTGNYTALQMQLMALMQKNHQTENEVIITYYG